MYVNLYPFEVCSKLKNGEAVKCFDKQKEILHDLQNETVKAVCELVRAADSDETHRYCFYIWTENAEEADAL